MRSDSRSLLFPGEHVTVVTLRPSDIPTYVEAGAADLGITGKDVLMEQPERVVYELLDLAYGRCEMVVATRAGNRFAEELERRLGAIRIATKYPNVATRHFEQSGRQAEVIEVKGSVELAPIVGLSDAIVDLTATGRTLRENDLEVRELIAECSARLIANRVAHKLRGPEMTRSWRDSVLPRRLELAGGSEPQLAAVAAEIRALPEHPAGLAGVGARDLRGRARARRRGGEGAQPALRRSGGPGRPEGGARGARGPARCPRPGRACRSRARRRERGAGGVGGAA